MSNPKGSLGILVGGGPAPGLNGVISAVTIAARQQGLDVYGIYDGYKWLVQDNEQDFLDHAVPLHIKDVSRIHFEGGSILRTSRTNPAKVENGVKNSVNNLNKLNIKYMVTIGGDDTSYGASEIAKGAEGKIKFAHVPKTIDNDLPLPNHLPTFGYQTARHVGSMLIKNLMEDAKTTQRWYLAVAMGRHAGHLGLGIAKSAGATNCVISEEFGDVKHIELSKVCDIFEGTILKRKASGSNHGVLIISEGVAEKFHPEELESIPGVKVEYDGYGHLRLAEVDLGKIVKNELARRFEERGDKLTIVESNLGYVLRCNPPIPFDQEYTRELGYNAVQYLMSEDPAHQKNAMICVQNGKLTPLYFEDMIDSKTNKTQVRMVEIESDSYKVSRSYMVRLQKKDFENADQLKKLVETAKMSEAEFKEKFYWTTEI